MQSSKSIKVSLRIGNGFDVHPLTPGRPLFLGGVQIPHNKGAVAHSDGDALIHSLCDALLGAASLGDIGRYFPDSSPEYKGIDSKILLSHTVALLKARGFEPVNIDAVVALQTPKIAPFIPQMRAVLAQILAIPEEAVSVKATTTESLGFVGREEGVAVYVVCLIQTLA
ncbi:MAG: 2-C-methyl-D-erythritol 2,4-cyclodiphosphate synthase [Bacteroidetes bacterium]|nr:2-C-methyl-D-erythritol 2,4-cyclodiphosphate synthase [Bacteroidota bacterium]